MSEFPVTLPGKHQQLANELNIAASDISESFTRGDGHGGQKVNNHNNCVELTHIPSGTTVRVHKHRAQSANRLSAYKLLIMKIEEQVKGKQSEKAKKIFKLRKQKQRRTRKSKEKMLEQKHRRSELKENRKSFL